VQLKRRSDLIPNLINAVKGFMQYEKNVLKKVTHARAQVVAAGSDVTKRAKAEGMLTQAIRSLFAVAEAYPELKAGQNVLVLQEELSSTENKISFARQAYNDSVMQYNITCQTFPSNLLANAFNFKEEVMFELDDKAVRAVPKVEF
jgi:LemA protein